MRAEGDRPVQWVLVVEEARGPNGSWQISMIEPVDGDIAQARAEAESLAFSYAPAGKQRSQPGRDVYRVGPDVWVADYKTGRRKVRTSFRVSVVRYVGSNPS